MHPVGFEPTHLSIAELKSAPLDHSGTNALQYIYIRITQIFVMFIIMLLFILFFFLLKKTLMEMRGIDPLAPRMRSECSTI